MSLCNQALDGQKSGAAGSHSSSRETALGAQLAAQVRHHTTPLGIISVDAFVQNLGLLLAAQMPNAPEDWKFEVTKDRQDSSTFEPLSLPGGWIFVPAQLILAAGSEGELAGMLAHAIELEAD